MNNKAPKTNTLSYYDVFSEEWVTVITIRHAAESSAKTNSNYVSSGTFKNKTEESINWANTGSLNNLMLPKVSPYSCWNK